MIGAVSTWWAGREPRERVLLGILGGLAALFLLVFAVLLPVQSARATAQAALDRAKSDAALVSRIVPSLGQAGGGRAPFDRSVLFSVSQAQDVRLTRVQPNNDGSFAVWIDDAETQALYGFFEALMGGYAVTVERAVVSADANGRLGAQFTVR